MKWLSRKVEIKDKYGALKGFNQANNYLIHKFVEVIEQIEQLQIEKLNYKRGQITWKSILIA